MSLNWNINKNINRDCNRDLTRRINKNTAIVMLSFHNEADNAFFQLVNQTHLFNSLSGVTENIGAYSFSLAELEKKELDDIVPLIEDHYYSWETMDQLIVAIQVHSVNGLGGFVDSTKVNVIAHACYWHNGLDLD